MTITHNKRTPLTLLWGVTIALVAAGCAPESTGVESSASLLETKQSVQLLRNLAFDRIPADQMAGAETDDYSAPCIPESSDPDGNVRRWVSEGDIVIVPGAMDSVYTNLVASFVDEGWTALERKVEGTSRAVTLTQEAQLADIYVRVLLDGETEGDTLQVETSGACVSTDGADSDEVLDLEQAGNG